MSSVDNIIIGESILFVYLSELEFSLDESVKRIFYNSWNKTMVFPCKSLLLILPAEILKLIRR